MDSELVWNMAMDSLLDAYERGLVKIVGFTDDASLLIKGPHVLVDLMEGAIKTAVEWGRASGLEFNALKTAVIMFGRTWFPGNLG